MTKKLLAIFALALALVSCKKDLNPKAVPHTSCDFELVAKEERQTKQFIYIPNQEGTPSCPEQTLEQLWLTKWNDILIETSSKDKKFDGVNFSSSNPNIIEINKIDDFKCNLIYKGKVLNLSSSQQSQGIILRRLRFLLKK